MVTCQSANQLKTPAKVSWVFKIVSQYGSVGYTIMQGKTADLTVVQKTIIDTLHKDADEPKATVKETWASTPPQQCHKLITSMPRRIEAVIKAKGAPTKYWVHIQ